MNKFLITQSLLSAWNWSYKTDTGQEDFLKTLERQSFRRTRPMLDGQQFENMVTAYVGGAPLEEIHPWSKGIQRVGDLVQKAVFQVKLSKTCVIGGVEFVLYGILDALQAGTIYDIKFSKKHYLNKYLDSPQHPMYFEICPTANTFTYLVSNGEDLFTETYRREDTPSIQHEITLFMRFLDENQLTDTYCKHWKSNY